MAAEINSYLVLKVLIFIAASNYSKSLPVVSLIPVLELILNPHRS